MPRNLNVIIIGAGPSGIALAHKLKQKLGFENFTVYEKLDGPGGTWRTNIYPGCGCDIQTHLYSFSFNLNPNWSEELCNQDEILQYMESTVDKFNPRPNMVFNTSCEGATWLPEINQWEVHLVEGKTKRRYTKRASIFVSAIGSIAEPRKIKFPGMDEFQGEVFHTARWNVNYNYRGKRMALIGNGCSAAQVVPSVVKDVKYIKHSSDALVTTYMSGEAARAEREATEKAAKQYIYSTAPQKYHDILVPKFPLGCKRRIFDPGYLDSLHSENLELVAEGISRFDATGIVSESGVHEKFDVVVLATGFDITGFLGSLKIVGKSGINLHEQWDKHVGAQAYMGMHIHNFPNLALMFGSNTFPAHNSVIFASEVQVDYIANTLFKPLMDGRAKIVGVKPEAEEKFVANIDDELQNTVFSAGCSNWYINKAGRNAASWPGYASTFWYRTLFPQWNDFILEGGDPLWMLRRISRSLSDIFLSKAALFCYAAGIGVWAK